MNEQVKSRKSGPISARGGVILLIMLGMLALFTLIAATFVISAGHFRRGAASASRAEQMGDPFEVLLQQALMQVVRGSNNPQSVIGPHSLLEDLYGDADSMAGMVVETSTNPQTGAVDMSSGLDLTAFGGPALLNSQGTRASFYPKGMMQPLQANNRPQDFSPMLLEFSAIGFGWDKEPGVALVDDDGNGVIDDVSEAMRGDDAALGSTYAHPVACGSLPGQPAATVWASKQLADGTALPIIDNMDNCYAGRVITFLTGEAAGRSSHIIRSKAVPVGNALNECVTMLWVQPLFGDVRPSSRDRFIINGRPFNGTGFGFSPYNNNALGDFQRKTDVRYLRRLDMRYTSVIGGNEPLVNVPIALLPNPTDPGYREYLASVAPVIDADEDYDAADYQNMLLAYRSWNQRRGLYETVMPSLHRPDLVNYFVRNFGLTDWTQLPPRIRRRVILRPETADHYDYTQEATPDPTASDGWNPAESYTDTNHNTQWDPGEPFQDRNNNNAYDTGDRTFAGNAFDAVAGPWDVDNDGDGEADSIWVDLGMPVTTLPDGRAVKPLFAILCLDLDGRLNVNAHGSTAHITRSLTPSDPLSLPDTNAVQRGSTEERYLLGAGAYANLQNNGSNKYAANINNPTKEKLAGEDANLYIAGSGAETGWAGRYLYDEPSRYQIGTQLFEPALGQGMSVADVNLTALYVRRREDMPTLPISTSTPSLAQRMARFRWLMEGSYLTGGVGTAVSTTTNQAQFIGTQFPMIGRYGEAHLLPILSFTYPAIGAPGAGVSIGSSDVLPSARFGDPGDDNYPGAPSPLRNGGGPYDLPKATAIVARGNASYEALILPNNTLNMQYGVYGTPGDPNADGFIALDMAGRPIYQRMGTQNETRDEPYEINLMNRYRPRGRTSLTTVEIDSNYTPGELARMLRIADPDASMYEGRLQSMFWNDYAARLNPYSQAVTTEQWDIPCPHIAPTPEMAAALRAMGLPVNNPSFGDLLRARFYLAYGGIPAGNSNPINSANSAKLATLSMRSYRQWTGPNASATDPNTDIISVSNPSNVPAGWRAHFSGARMTKAGFKRRHTRLISPDLVVGLRMNVNAPLGNGFDDDNDGVVDDPMEQIDVAEIAGLAQSDRPHVPTQPLWSGKSAPVLPGDTTFVTQFQAYANGGLRADTNRDGNYDARVDEMAHQQQAKELYCLMMLLIDQNYVIPNLELTTVADGTGLVTSGYPEDQPPAPPLFQFNSSADPYSRAKTYKGWLTARQIAQWAINAVDFRDRDSIMTPFEYDVDPFYDNDKDVNLQNISAVSAERPNVNGTWDVDGLVADDPDDGNTGDSTKYWRGLVWGCEYPDLILTETLAFHDRRTQNLKEDDGTIDPMKDGYTITNPDGSPVTDASKQHDPHWDQARMPQGSLFVELYATGNPHMSLNGNDGVYSALPRELYLPDGRLHLSKVVVGRDPSGQPAANPVWRLAITAAADVTNTLDANNVARRAARHPSTCSFNPIESWGAPAASAPPQNFSIIPPLFTGNGQDYQPVQVNRIVAFSERRIQGTRIYRRPGLPWQDDIPAMNVNAAPEPVFTGNNVPDVFFYTDRRPAITGRNDGQDRAVTAAPGDYVVVGPHRPVIVAGGGAVPQDVLDNITTIGSTHYLRGTETPPPPDEQPGLATADPNGAAVLTPTTPAGKDRYLFPPPVIDLGNNLKMGQIYTDEDFFRTMPDPGNNKFVVSPTHWTRPFVASNISGIDEYPKPSFVAASAYIAVKQTALLAQTNYLNAVLSSTAIVLQPGSTLQPASLWQSQANTWQGQVNDQFPFAQIRRPVVVPCAVVDNNGGTATNFGDPVGLNISEPMVNGGPAGQRHAQLYKGSSGRVADTTTSLFDARLKTRDTWKLSSAGQPGEGPCPDVPFDGIKGSVTNPELVAMGIKNVQDATYLNVKTVFLQRLADPTRIWNADTNPYITLDWMPIDLTLFNGESQKWVKDESKAAHVFDPANPPKPAGTYVDSSGNATPVRFGTRQRGTPSRPMLGRYSNFDLWSQPNWLDTNASAMSNWYAAPPPTKRLYGLTNTVIKNKYFKQPATQDVDETASLIGNGMPWQHPLQHTLGYLNVGYHVNRVVDSLNNKPNLTTAAVRTPFVRPPGTRPAVGGAFSNPPPWDVGWFIGYDLCQGVTPRADLALYIGSPRRPFNWLAWNNRPYASAMELMMVPSSGASRLLHDFDMRRTGVFPLNAGLAPTAPIAPLAFPDERRRSANEYLPLFNVWIAGGTSPANKFGYTQAPPFRYLLNFFTSSVAAPAMMQSAVTTSSLMTATSGTGFRASDVQPNFYRIFEFLTVPSRFAGTQQQHMHGRYTQTGGFQGVWNNALFYYNTNGNNPQQDFLIAATPPGVPNPGTPTIYSAQYEHPGWPFTAPNNVISMYREPGRINVNTIPIIQPGAQVNQPRGNDKNHDYGAVIWRAAINEFFPGLHSLVSAGYVAPHSQFGSITFGRGYNVRDGFQVSNGPPQDFESSSDDYIDNFFTMYSGMRSDWPRFDFRGRNATWEGGGGDDLVGLLNDYRLPASADRESFRQPGYTPPGRMDPQKPAWIANPIRSFVEDYSATPPQPEFQTPYIAPLPLNHESAYQRVPFLAADSTLMRRKDTTWLPWQVAPYDPTPGVQANLGTGDVIPHIPQSALHIDPVFDPLFALNFPRPQNNGVSGYTISMLDLNATNPADPNDRRNTSWIKSTDYRNSDRNPFFRYQLYTKLGSVVTTRSNVYAIWITMGSFECERVSTSGQAVLPSQNGFSPNDDLPMTQRFPDGFRILREAGSDTGEVRRHKIFAIFDRSLPVGFKRGENYNVDQAFLLRHIVN